MNTTIAVIGAGELGSRHLQSLAVLKKSTTIQVIDVSEESLKLAKKRYEEVAEQAAHNVQYLQHIYQLNENITMAIIATSSLVRRTVVEELLTTKKVTYLLLEKVLFPRIQDYQWAQQLISKYQVKAWVNCGRREFEYVQIVKQALTNESYIHFDVLGTEWGLACNGIHFIDLFAYLTQTTANYNYDITRLDKGFIESKRSGYIELTGTLRINTPCGEMNISSYKGEISSIIIIIHGKNTQIVIQEGQRNMCIIKANETDLMGEYQLNIPYQSQATAPLVENILEKGNCKLPTLEESCELHMPFIQAVLDHINQSEREDKTLCPIT